MMRFGVLLLVWLARWDLVYCRWCGVVSMVGSAVLLLVWCGLQGGIGCIVVGVVWLAW